MASTGAVDPMAAMLASMGLGAGQKDQTVMEYDKKQLAKVSLARRSPAFHALSVASASPTRSCALTRHPGPVLCRHR
eukprot:scaffold230725_cov30-Tisochrysis_lutea.AAC.3